MEFVFVFPESKKTFNSNQFTLQENKGVKTDTEGNRILDAKVVLTAPCPFCGRKHVYKATDLSCPFTGSPETGKD